MRRIGGTPHSGKPQIFKKEKEEIMERKILELVDKICSIEGSNCRSLNKSDLARELMNIAKIPENAIISEIPLDWDRQVVIAFYLPKGKIYYELFAGIGLDGNFHFDLYEIGILKHCADGVWFDFYDKDRLLPINYFGNLT